MKESDLDPEGKEKLFEPECDTIGSVFQDDDRKGLEMDRKGSRF